jgi:DNA modification methylase
VNVQQIKIDLLIPAAYNPRKIAKAELDKLKKNITEFGMVDPIIVNHDMTVIGGHQRLKACLALKMETVPCVVLNVSKEKEKALNLSLNRISGEWDEEVLQQLIGELATLDDFDMDLTGFDSKEIDKMIASIGKESKDEEHFDADAEAAKIGEPRTVRGDVWVLGNHRLVCGDSTSMTDVDKVMDGKRSKMVFTDPPWNVAIGLDSNPKHRQREGMKNDNLSAEDFRDFLSAFIAGVSCVNDGDIYCVLGASEWPTLDSTLRENGYHWSATIIWVKDTFVLGRSKYHRRYEPIWYGWHSTKTSSFNNEDRRLDDVWEVKRPKKSIEHPTMKPVELVEIAIINSSSRGDVVFEPFGGGGSTLMAAEKTGRACRCIEISPRYCDVIVNRWEKYTGKTAVLETAQEPVHA